MRMEMCYALQRIQRTWAWPTLHPDPPGGLIGMVARGLPRFSLRGKPPGGWLGVEQGVMF